MSDSRLFHKSLKVYKTPLTMTIDHCLQGFNFDKVFSPSSSPTRSPPRQQQQHSGASTRHFDNFPDVTTSFGSQVNTTETGGIQAYLSNKLQSGLLHSDPEADSEDDQLREEPRPSAAAAAEKLQHAAHLLPAAHSAAPARWDILAQQISEITHDHNVLLCSQSPRNPGD